MTNPAVSKSRDGNAGMKAVWIISLGLFVIFLDGTVVNIALPNMIAEFQMSLRTASWIINAYTITVASMLVFMGRLSDISGKLRMYVIGLVLFMLSSLLCAIAPSAGLLIAARVMQGISGAISIPASMSLVRSVAPAEKVGTAMGIWSAVGALAIAVGPTVGGLLTEYVDWRLVFFLNVPVILTALWLTRKQLRGYREERIPGKLDVTGTVLLTAGLFLLVNSLLSGHDFGWRHWMVSGGLIVSIVSLLVFVLLQRLKKHPLIDLGIFRDRGYTVGAVSNMLGGMLLMGTLIVMPLYLTQIKHFSIIKTSLIITPMSAIMLVAAPLTGKLIDRIGPRLPLLCGYLITASDYFLLSRIQTNTTTLQLMLLLTGAGIGVGVIAVTSLTLSTATIPMERLSSASGLFAMLRNLGGALGVALFIALSAGGSGTAFLGGCILALLFACSTLVLPGKRSSQRDQSSAIS